MIKTNPQKLAGNWDAGYALDLHTISSQFAGYDSYGHEQYTSTRSEIGELLYNAKYAGTKTALDAMAEAASTFIAKQGWKIDLIIPTPPSDSKREYQPVPELAKRISKTLRIPVCPDCLSKVKDTGQLKNENDATKRKAALEAAFSASPEKLTGKSVLVLDDLYRSGATLSEIAQELRDSGAVKRIYVLAITKTRRKR